MPLSDSQKNFENIKKKLINDGYELDSLEVFTDLTIPIISNEIFKDENYIRQYDIFEIKTNDNELNKQKLIKTSLKDIFYVGNENHLVNDTYMNFGENDSIAMKTSCKVKISRSTLYFEPGQCIEYDIQLVTGKFTKFKNGKSLIYKRDNGTSSTYYFTKKSRTS